MNYLAILISLFISVVFLFLMIRFLFPKIVRQIQRWYFLKRSPEFLCILEANNPIDVFPKRGEIFLQRFHSPNNVAQSSYSNQIRIVSLNIEMGQQFDSIVHQIQRLNPDILFLQEVDMCVPRTHRVDIAGEIARIFNMDCVFACEIENPMGHFSNKPQDSGGCEGNAILSKFPIRDARSIVVECPRSRNKHKYKTHAEAMAIISTHFGDIHACSIHLDPHLTGKKGRANQFRDIFEELVNPNCRLAIIAGDFNTMSRGLARISPSIESKCCPTLGYSEAEWFDKNVVRKLNQTHGTNFYDPFDKVHDVTLKFGGLSFGKLDWCLLNGFRTVGKQVGNKVGDQCSDHYWICVDAVLSSQ